MSTKTEVRPLWTKLVKALLIVTTTTSSSIVTAAPDPVPCEPAQLDPSGSSIETKSESRRIASVALERATHRRETGMPPGLIEDAPIDSVAYDEFVLFEAPPHMSRTAFGAGSFVLGALGANASIPRTDST
ncbi:hypothetical protein [Caballeronia sp. SBC2]|uniref:hypothetical protein n=1 Tax=Caballeronia sp. SBC2 TaxID=2705547 RepID=UPI0013E1F6FA|nr:hypothetical protein [Caballeronia sp. SBC2]QIE30508.1 hypothetical protein SBC2_85850 [Caballeronia sp. SBC2]